MCELPDVFSQTTRRARRNHTCCECDLMIRPGERYEVIKGLWYVRWETYKTCLSCAAWRKVAVDYIAPDYEEGPAFGQLAHFLADLR